MDNPLKRSFDLNYKGEEDQPDPSEKVDHDTAFDQSQGAASFLNEQSNPFVTEEEDELPDEMKDQQFGSDDEEEEDEEEMEEIDRGAVEDVLAKLNDDYEPQGRNENEDRGAVEDVLRSLNHGEQGKYDFHEGDHAEEEEEEEEMDEIVADVLSDLNEDEQINEDEEDPCWDDYTMVGMKTDENGNEVPNCVPDDEAENYDPDESASIDEDEVMEAVLEDLTSELNRLDQLAERVLNG